MLDLWGGCVVRAHEYQLVFLGMLLLHEVIQGRGSWGLGFLG